MFKKVAVMVACGVVLGILGGCGSSDDATSAEAAPLPKAVFVKKANAICKETAKKLLGEVTAVAENGNGSEATRFTEAISTAVVPALEAEIEDIRGLGIPASVSDQHDVNAFLDIFQEIVDEARANPEEFTRRESPYKPAEVAGDPYGLTSCPLG